MYKVFNQQRTIIFTENLTFIKLSHNDSLIELEKIDDVIPVYQEYISKKVSGDLIFLIKKELRSFVDKFSSKFNFIEAAGGLIVNPKGELLMIFRFGKWDLPKGKIEKGEPIESAAIRECVEETALQTMSIEKEIESTFHIYEVNQIPMLKRTYWFAMHSDSENELIPQTEEGIEMAKWMNREEVVEAVKNTYESLKGLIENNYLKK